ncbi:hypothetical protein [Photobacterium ganghwense]|uniref:hypothetical protein n=1 Tax=Photobacterium ganghwense TaxID=320778 RepID=UPI001C2D729B|nr:hypothetical protein [Photobacterium ganghwense]MBV1839077.1 hypothetical protein [Photobacterium ganghwense]
MALRYTTTITPVGPRGDATLAEKDKLWFSLQIAAGFSDASQSVDNEQLLPWSLLKTNHQDMIELDCWLFDGTNFTMKESVTSADIVLTDAGRKIRDSITAAIKEESLDQRLLLPAEYDSIDEIETYLANSGPARINYLSALPGELSRQLLANVYFQISKQHYYEILENGKWEPVTPDGILWVNPKHVIWQGVSSQVTGSPLPASTNIGPIPDVWMQATAVNAQIYSPGFRLRDYPSNAQRSPLFNLESYWLEVDNGNPAMEQTNDLIADLASPFDEISNFSADDLHSFVEVPTEASTRALRREETSIVKQVWLSVEFAKLLDAANAQGQTDSHIKATIRELARYLASLADSVSDIDQVVRDIVDKTPAWATLDNPLDDLSSSLQLICKRLGIGSITLRERVQALADKANMNGLVTWVVNAFNEAIEKALLADQSGDVQRVNTVWEFSSPAQRTGRRAATVKLILVERLNEVWSRPSLDDLIGQTVGQNSADILTESLVTRLSDITSDRWLERLDKSITKLLAELGMQGVDKTKDLIVVSTTLQPVVSERIIERWPGADDLATGAELPGDGLHLVIGAPEYQVVHEENTDADLIGESPGGTGSGIFDDVTGHVLLVRRHNDDTQLPNEPWQLVSSGVAMAGEPPNKTLFDPATDPSDWLHELLPIAEENAFVNGTLRSSRSYDGRLKHIQQPLRLAYDATMNDTEQPVAVEPAFSYQGLGLFSAANIPDGLQDALPIARSAILRFGDYYQFKAGLVDAGGGLPKAIAQTDEPWRLNLATFTSVLSGTSSRPIPYLRRIPVGEVNILPTQGLWQVIPTKMRLRAREWWAGVAGDQQEGRESRNVPTLILTPDDGAFDKAIESYTFDLAPPTTDENTLLRWVVPTKDETTANKNSIRDLYERTVTRVIENRRTNPDSPNPELMPHDPAVSALGFRVSVFGATGNLLGGGDIVEIIQLTDDDFYRKKRVGVEVSIGDRQSQPLSNFSNPVKLTLRIPEGSFACIRTYPLVTKMEFDTRFSAIELFDKLAPDQSHWPDYRAFDFSAILVEAATAQLPSATSLYEGFQLNTTASKEVEVSILGLDESVAFIDRYEVQCERWVWRNRPIVSTSDVPNWPADQVHRLLLSGPPEPAFDPTSRDNNDEVKRWEAIADLDNGFIERPVHEDSWPRNTPREDHAGGSQDQLVLFRDPRDGASGADYLRYGLKVYSLYAAMLKNPNGNQARQRDEQRQTDEIWRRILVPSVVKDLKPPKVLSIIPLTKRLAAHPLDQLENPHKGTTEFLLILDETWFREYGIGEGLEAHLALENLDIDDRDDEPRPYATGPLADHYLPGSAPDKRYYRNKEVTSIEPPIELNVFGPFGFTLDENPDEALSATTAFVLSVPEDVGPLWTSFVRFRRVLDKPNPTKHSEYSDRYALYTLADGGALVTVDPDIGKIEWSQANKTVTLRDISMSLYPLAQDQGSSDQYQITEELERNYRYYMVLFRVVHAAGQPGFADQPVALLKLKAPAGGELKSGVTTQAELIPGGNLGVGPFHGRILEVLVNGKYPGEARIDEVSTVSEFWQNVLATADPAQGKEDPGMIDAAGMIRRISDAFDVITK